ncbi:hypothetical protein M408DRAFT_330373, partial [Serendipita vermifera MAFF 305830]
SYLSFHLTPITWTAGCLPPLACGHTSSSCPFCFCHRTCSQCISYYIHSSNTVDLSSSIRV